MYKTLKQHHKNRAAIYLPIIECAETGNLSLLSWEKGVWMEIHIEIKLKLKPLLTWFLRDKWWHGICRNTIAGRRFPKYMESWLRWQNRTRWLITIHITWHALNPCSQINSQGNWKEHIHLRGWKISIYIIMKMHILQHTLNPIEWDTESTLISTWK